METKIDDEDQHGEGYLKGIRYLPEERGGRNCVEDPYNTGVAMYVFPEDVRLINVEMTVKRATATGANEICILPDMVEPSSEGKEPLDHFLWPIEHIATTSVDDDQTASYPPRL